MDVITLKVLSGILFFFLVIIFGWIPFYVLRRCMSKARSNDENKLPFVDFLHSMASGVLVATCLLSLLPEAIEAVHETLGGSHTLEGRSVGAGDTGARRDVDTERNGSSYETNEHVTFAAGEKGDFSYPVAELLVALGFLTIYMLDSCVKSVQSSWGRSSDKMAARERSSMVEMKNKFDSIHDHSNTDGYFDNDSMSIGEKTSDSGVLTKNSLELVRNYNSGDDASLRLGEDDVSGSAEDHPLADQTHRSHNTSAAVNSQHLRSIALVGALCVHGFFDGLLLGLQTSTHVLLSLLLALAIHKCFVSISLSLTLFNHHDKYEKVSRIFLYVCLFAIVAPLGITMSASIIHGGGATGEEGSAGLAAGCLQAFAVGTFMYVAFTETMEQHHHHRGSLRTQCISHLFMMLGFSAMAGLRAALGEV